MPRRLIVYIALGLVAVLVSAALGRFVWLARNPAVDLKISTGTEGGTYITLGGQLARVLDEFGSARIGNVEPIPSGGSVQNARRLAMGEADLSFVVEPVLAATEPRDQLSVLLALYNNVTQILVRKDSDIKALGDLRSKRVFAGVRDSGTRWLTSRLLAAVDLGESDYERVSLGGWDQVEAALRSRQIDAGANVRTVDDQGNTALHLVGEDADSAKALLEADADVMARNHAGETPLHRAAKVFENHDVIALLVSHGADSSAKDASGKTPYDVAMEAAQVNQLEALRHQRETPID